MSFSENLKKDLIEIPIKKNCCKKAFLLGLLINARRDQNNQFEYDSIISEIVDIVEELLFKVFSVKGIRSVVLKPGKKYYTITFSSKVISNYFDDLVLNPDVIIQDAAAFKCSICEQSFFRGAFLSCARINDPEKGYHLEFSFHSDNIAIESKFYRFLSVLGFVPKIINRKNNLGLYIKNNSVISDVLYYIGAVKMSFEYSNTGIEKEIRNNENRATNCVTNNIFRSVSASHKQIEAIERLREFHKLETLTDELKETAMIRLNNPEASMVELALLHSPPISKSGLNHRLKKIILEAENIKD